jgi:hypothetical protein
MSKKTIEKNLKEALLEDGELVDALFEYELAEHVGEYLESKKKDGDKYFFAVTEHTNDVAMLLIDEFDNVHRNQVARELLKSLWHDAYKSNMQKLIPQIAQELNSGLLFTAGVKVMKNPKSFWRKG